MKSILALRHLPVILLLLACVLLFPACPGPKPTPPDTPTVSGAGYTPVATSGSVLLPSGSQVNPAELKVRAGCLTETQPNADGSFNLQCNKQTTQLVSAVRSNGDPYLLSIAITPQVNTTFGLSSTSTAAALIFMSPAVIISDPALSRSVMGIIEDMPETQQLANVVSNRLGADPSALVSGDAQIQSALSIAITRFVSKIDSVAQYRSSADSGQWIDEYRGLKHYGNSTLSQLGTTDQQVGDITISPNTPQSGVSLTATKIDASNYRINIKNSKKRYVDAYLDDALTNANIGSAFLQSRKSLVSFSPLSPFSRDLNNNLNIGQHPKTILRAYSLGAHGLTELKAAPHWQSRVLPPVLFTGLFDFVLPTIEVVTGIKQVKMLGSWDNPGGVWGNIIDDLRNSPTFAAKIADDLGHADYTGAITVTVKSAFDVVIDNPSYLIDWLKEQGMSAIQSIVQAMVLPLRIISIVTTGFELGSAVYDFFTSHLLVSFTISADVDNTPPSRITTFATKNPTSSSITLTWTAVGDDGQVGTASSYDIRYSTSTITSSNWNAATQVAGEPTPKSAGSSETFTVTGLTAGTTYYFAIETADDKPNWSDLSNVPSEKTSGEGGPGYWSPLGSGMNRWVYALTVYSNKVIAGGAFDSCGTLRAAKIAAWNGSSWSSLGSGTDFHIQALTVYSNKVIAGGLFTTAGGVHANQVAAWNGSSWSPLGTGIGGATPSVEALTVYNNQLVAGGRFETAGGVNANNIAVWDGSSWSPLGSGMGGAYHFVFVLALTVYNNNLIAGGMFSDAGGVSAHALAAWNGSSWSPIGSAKGDVYALTIYDNKLIAGGTLSFDDWVSTSYVAAWDGSSWSPLGSGMNGPVHVLTVYDNKLIAGGEFTTVGGVSANYIAAWDGSSWSPLGSGTDGTVYGLTVHNNELVAGGWFTSAGGVSANYIAAWSK